MHPLPQVDITAASIFKGVINGQVAVAKDEKINCRLFEFVVAVYRQPFLRLPEKFFFRRVDGPAATGEKAGQPYAKIGVQPRKSPLAKGVSEYALQDFIPLIARPKTVAMSYVKGMASKLAYDRRTIDRYTELLFEIVEHPHVVVARKDVYRQARVAQFRELAQKAHIATRHDAGVLKPEVEQITDQKEFRRIAPDVVQPAQELRFALPTAQPGIDAEVKVRRKIYFLPLHHLVWLMNGLCRDAVSP